MADQRCKVAMCGVSVSTHDDHFLYWAKGSIIRRTADKTLIKFDATDRPDPSWYPNDEVYLVPQHIWVSDGEYHYPHDSEEWCCSVGICNICKARTLHYQSGYELHAYFCENCDAL